MDGGNEILIIIIGIEIEGKIGNWIWIWMVKIMGEKSKNTMLQLASLCSKLPKLSLLYHVYVSLLSPMNTCSLPHCSHNIHESIHSSFLCLSHISILLTQFVIRKMLQKIWTILRVTLEWDELDMLN